MPPSLVRCGGGIFAGLHSCLILWVTCLCLLSTSSLALSTAGASSISKTIKTPHGDVFDCVDIQAQEGLKHPRLAGHRVQSQVDSRAPKFVYDGNFSSSLTPFQSLDCPPGTVPQLRLPSSTSIHDHYLLSSRNTSLKYVSSKSATVTTVDAGYTYNVDATGVAGMLQIWNPSVENFKDEFSGAFISLGSGTDQILAGWLVSPELYNDNYPRFTIANTKDNFKSRLCYNPACGFVVLSNVVGLGLRFAAVSSSSDIRNVFLSITKDEKGWLLTVNQEHKVGYWPYSLFNNIKSGLARAVSWSGRIANSYPSGRYTKTQMGNGISASSDSAAAISYLVYLDTSGQLQLANPSRNAPAQCYTSRLVIIPTANGNIPSMFYGGSGYDSGCSSSIQPPVVPSPPPPFVPEEIRSLFLNPPLSNKHQNKYFRYASYRYTGDAQDPNWDLTASINFVSLDQVGDIEDQGECNACWAFAPVAALESAYAIAKGAVPRISKQQILDCAPTQAKNGSCGGGWVTDAFEFMATSGLATRAQYPYIGNQQSCYTVKSPDLNVINISMYEEVDFYGSFGLILAVQNQPVVVNVQASSSVFQTFTGSDVFDRPECFTDFVDHSVVIVGYALFGQPKPYWILRNSFGKSWGDNGYMKIAYTGGEGICGMHATPAYYPVLPVGTQNACGPLNPCGGGRCSIHLKTGKQLCSCPPGFVAVTSIDGTQTCTTLNPCQTKTFNPCGNGVCVNDRKGSYTCICPRGFAQSTFANVDASTCVPATSGNQLVYTTQSMDTCDLISLAFRLTLAEFRKQNPSLNCNQLKIGTKVNVKQTVNWKNCATTYSWNKGDSCNDIQNLFSITRSTLLSLNPGLVCTNVVVGYQMCIQQGTPFPDDLPCSTTYIVRAGDTCESIIKAKQLDPFFFFQLNRGINCRALVPPAKGKGGVISEQVCIDVSNTGLPKCKKTVKIRKGDTCSRIYFNYFNRSLKKFRKCNKPLNCRQLKIGKTYCAKC